MKFTSFQPSGKFALLKHILPDNSIHYDLVLEGKEQCPTFQSDTVDFIVFKRITDHRPHYLEFSGFISEEKGEVLQLENGTYQFDLEANELRLSSGLCLLLGA